MWIALAATIATGVAACATPGDGSSANGGRYVDPYTCEIKNKHEKDPPYDPDCIRAAQASAIAAARQAARASGKK